MRIQTTARHCTIAEPVRAHAEERVLRLLRFERRLEAAELIFENDSGLCHVEVRLAVARQPLMVAHGTGPDFRTALDRAVARAARQLKRRHDRRHDHQAPKPPEAPAPPGQPRVTT